MVCVLCFCVDFWFERQWTPASVVLTSHLQIYMKQTTWGQHLEHSLSPSLCLCPEMLKSIYSIPEYTSLFICHSSPPKCLLASMFLCAVFHGCISLIDDIVHVHWNRKCFLFPSPMVVIKQNLSKQLWSWNWVGRNAKFLLLFVIVLKVPVQNFIAH